MATESTLRIIIDSSKAKAQAEQLNKQLNKLEQNGDRASNSADALSGTLKKLSGAMAGVLTVSTAINKMDAYSNMQNRLRLVTKSQVELNKATEDTYQIAIKTYQSWDSVVQVYQRFSDNAKTLGINMQQTAALTETVSRAVAISGASTQAAEAALTQFGQALASGVLRGEELNSVMEQTPALAKAIAQGMGITVGQLRAVAAEGRITSDVLIDALAKSADDVNEKFSKMQITIGQALTNLDTQFTKFAENTAGVSGAIANSINSVAQNLDTLANASMVVAAYWAGTYIPAIMSATAAGYAKVKQLGEQVLIQQAAISADRAAAAQEVLNAEAKIASLTAAKALLIEEAKVELQRKKMQISTQGAINSELRLGLIRNQLKTTSVELAAAENALATARTRSDAAANASLGIGRGLLGVLGGPVGIGVTLATVAAGYLLLSKNTEESTKSLRENNEGVDDAISKYRELNSVQQAGQLVAEKKKLEELESAYRKTVRELEAFSASMGSNNEFVSESQIELAKLLQEYRKTGDIDQFNKSVQSSSKVSQDAKDKVATLSTNVFNAGQTAKTQKTFIDSLNSSVQSLGNSADNTADSIRNMADAQRGFFKDLNQRAIDSAVRLGYMGAGYSKEVIDEIEKLREAKEKDLGGGQTAIITQEEIDRISNMVGGIKRVNDEEERLSESRRKRQSNSNKAERDILAAQRERERALTEQLEKREEIQYRYADRYKKIEIDLQKEVNEIYEAGFAKDKTDFYIAQANKRANAEIQIYKKQLEIEANEFRDSEERKLQRRKELEELTIGSSDMNRGVKKVALAASDARYKHEVELIRLAKEERIFQAEEFQMSEIDRIEKRYDLEMRRLSEINDAEERNRIARALSDKKEQELKDAKERMQIDLAGTQGVDTSALTEQLNRDKIIREAYQNGIIESQEEFHRMLLESQTRYENAKLAISMNSMQGTLSGWTQVFANMQGEQSTAYKAMFAVQKAFALAQVLLNSRESYSKAYNAVVGTPVIGPYIAPAFGAAAVGLQLAQAAQIRTVSAGFKTGGYTGNYGVNEVAGVVHGQEYVMNAEATKRIGVQNLEAMASGKSPTGDSYNPTIVIVDDREKADQYIYGRDGRKAIIKVLSEEGIV